MPRRSAFLFVQLLRLFPMTGIRQDEPDILSELDHQYPFSMKEQDVTYSRRLGRTLHPHTQGAVGLRHLLPDFGSPSSRTCPLDESLQSSPTPCWHRQSDAYVQARGESVNNLLRTHN